MVVNGFSMRRKRERSAPETEAHAPAAQEATLTRDVAGALAQQAASFESLSPEERALQLCRASFQAVWERSLGGNHSAALQAFRAIMDDAPGALAQSLSAGAVRVSSQNSSARSRGVRVPSLGERKEAVRRDIRRFEEETRHWADLDASISDAGQAGADENAAPAANAAAKDVGDAGALLKTQSLQKAMLQASVRGEG